MDFNIRIFQMCKLEFFLTFIHSFTSFNHSLCEYISISQFTYTGQSINYRSRFPQCIMWALWGSNSGLAVSAFTHGSTSLLPRILALSYLIKNFVLMLLRIQVSFLCAGKKCTINGHLIICLISFY